MRILSAGFHLPIAYPATKGTHRNDLDSRMLTLSGVHDIPDSFIYKQTYQVKGRSQEGPLLSRFSGEFGIADIIGYHNCEASDRHGSTTRLSNGARFWNVFGQEKISQDKQPEERQLQCIALSGEGKVLVDVNDKDQGISSPSELLESILHAFIGKYCYLCASLFTHVCQSRSLQPVQERCLTSGR